ncbi:extracellular solute-binding protein [Paenibacillus nasutitermitis]|uniref:Lipoprotein LipO n=1 Tax=Paenibacillus nasutitermitis TaxID=1652958 RepID=A0A916YMA7_9BACL|nr:extracellular solute-binding protein [Paenibacillus nasutitermitis]GGD51640.1 lipoprotein LipO [Paenibacillus nasutitermitis]
MMRLRNQIGLIVLLCLMLGLTACGDSNTKNSSKQTNGAANAQENAAEKDGKDAEGSAAPLNTDPLGAYDPPVEITAVRSMASTMKFENGDSIGSNGWTKLYEKELGIKLKYLWVTDNSQYEQKLNVMMASGQLPDILSVPAVQMKQMYDAGLLEDISGALDTYGSERTKELLNKDGGVALDSATFKGQLVGLPMNPGSVDSAPLLWVRADWLKKLNLEEPKTIDDVYVVAEAFVKNDPDGNGKNDTYGLGVAKEFYGAFAGLDGFFNGFHTYPGIWVEDASGELVYGSVQPQMKTALTKLQEMYKKGVIDQEFGVKNGDQLIQDVNAGKMGIFYGGHYMPLLFQEGKNNNADMDLRPIQLPSADGEIAKPQTTFSVPEYYVVRKGAEHPEAVVKLMNAFYEPWSRDKYPVAEISQNGDVEKWQYALVKGSNPTQNLDNYNKIKSALDKNDESVLDQTTGQPYIYGEIKKLQSGDNSGWGYGMVFGPGGSQSLLNAYNDSKGFQPTAFISGPTEAMTKKQATLSKMELETFTKIVMGSAPVDSFDEFVASWKKLGGDEITNEVAKWKASK